jgi:hypothetical protein
MVEENIEQPKKKRQRKSKVETTTVPTESEEQTEELKEKFLAQFDTEPEETGGTVKRIGTVTRYLADTGIYEFSRLYKKVKYAIANRHKGVSGAAMVTILHSDKEGKPLSNVPIATFKNISVEEAFAKIGYTLQ